MLLTDTVRDTAYVPLEVGSHEVYPSEAFKRFLVFADHVRLMDKPVRGEGSLCMPAVGPDRGPRSTSVMAQSQDLLATDGRNVFHHGK